MASDECVTKYVWQKINDSINKTVNEIKLDELVKESKELNPEGCYPQENAVNNMRKKGNVRCLN